MWIDVPTVLVALASWILWGYAWMHRLPCLAIVAFYAMFTPLHESSHRNISSNKLINDSVGVACGIPLFAQLHTFRAIHRQHHASTNHDTDPDMWASHGPFIIMPLRWASLFIFYLYYAITHDEIYISYTFYMCLFLCIVMLWIIGAPVLAMWIIPQFLATLILAFTLDFLPHAWLKPGRYRDTRMVSTNFLVAVMTFMQSMHIVHHVNSKIVWWKYYRHLPKLVESILIPNNRTMRE